MLDVYNDAILNTTAVYQEETHSLSMRKRWFEEKQQAGLPVFAAYLNGEFAEAAEALKSGFEPEHLPDQIKVALGMSLLRIPLLPSAFSVRPRSSYALRRSVRACPSP